MSVETTGIKVSYEEGLASIRAFPLLTSFQGRYNYAMLMEEDDGTYNLVHRIGMPCWGALREYNKGTRASDPWPGDLRTPRHLFPTTGKPVAVAAFFATTPLGVVPNAPGAYNSQASLDDWNAFIEFIFDPELSPWKKALSDYELVKAPGGNYQGVVFLDTKIDPNAMLALLRTNVNHPNIAINFCTFLRNNPGVDPRVAYLKCQSLNSYNMVGRVILDKYFTGEGVDISAGGTFYERESYNRPDIQFYFGGKNNEGVIVADMSVEQLTEALNGIIPQGN